MTIAPSTPSTRTIFALHPNTTIDDYLANAWPDFIEHQMKPFGDFPVFLGIGNHELVTPKTRPLYIAQFADWLDQASDKAAAPG